jgi:predicted porin
MKKSLLALAAMGAFAGAAQAQSSVTVSGLVEAGYTSKSVRAVGSANNDAVTQAAIAGTMVGTPVLRVLGSEDLGGGMSAGFLLTQEFDTSSGAFSTSNGFTEAMVSISPKGFGTISAGKMNPATRDLGGVYRFMGDIGRFSTALNSPAAQSNHVQYVTPSFQGFSASISNSSIGKTVSAGVDTNAPPQGQTTYGISGTIGKARVAVAQETLSYASTGGADQAKNTLTSFGGSYDFGVAKLGAAYVDQKITVAGGADGGKRNAYTINAAAPVTKVITLGASYASYEVTPAAGGDKPKAVIMTVAAQYAFSKRTSIYASYQQVTNSGANNALKASSATGINDGAVGTSRNLGVAEINGGTGTGFGLTAVHTF